MRRARERLGHGTRRRLGADPGRRAPRRRADAGGVRQPGVGRPRPAHAVPDDLHDAALDPDARRVGAAAAEPLTVDVEARLRELEDREEIRDLLATYARHLDAGDHAAYADLFAEQGELVARLGSAKGPTAIR